MTYQQWAKTSWYRRSIVESGIDGIDFLSNAVRVPGLTCQTCTAPVRGHDVCWRCRQYRGPAADVVMPLTYAIARTASSSLLRDYKQHPARAVREDCSAAIGSIVSAGAVLHARCIENAVAMPVTLYTTVPSLTYRPGVHPLVRALSLAGVASGPVLLAGPEATCDRTVSAAKFQIAEGADVAGRHVLVLDDVWTTGSNAQSAALTLKRAGAAAVSVLVVARWLDPAHPVVERFVQRHLRRPYDPSVCPVTGRYCVD